MALGTTAGQERQEDEAEFLGRPKDWIDRFSRDFYPTVHRHMGEQGGHATLDSGGEQRELLPWLRLAASLDPERTETYLVASYWLRSKLGKVNEAEHLLREGLRANPGDCDILFELGRIYDEHRHDRTRARNLWELALAGWLRKNSGKPDPEVFVYGQILGHLARLEEREQHYAKALQYLKTLQTVSPYKAGLQKWIESLTKLQAGS